MRKNLHAGPGGMTLGVMLMLLVNDSLLAWITSAGLSVNLAKSTLLLISRMRSKPSLSILLNSTPVPISDSVKYLGVTISSDLTWNRHVSNICLSASQCQEKAWFALQDIQPM